MNPYQDVSLAPAERARDLLDRLTLREKVGQLNQRLYGFQSVQRSGDTLSINEETLAEIRHFGGLGTLYGLYRADPWSGRTQDNGITPELAAKAYNLVQRAVLEQSRFGIPALLSEECPHGHQALGGYLLPVNLAMGATFDPQLVEQAFAVCGRQLKSMGTDFALMSVLDMLRDPAGAAVRNATVKILIWHPAWRRRRYAAAAVLVSRWWPSICVPKGRRRAE